jgi:hypothetical protein
LIIYFQSKKLGEEFHELSDNHPWQKKFKNAGTRSSFSRTLNDVYAERSKKKLRILRAIVNLGRGLGEPKRENNTSDEDDGGPPPRTEPTTTT